VALLNLCNDEYSSVSALNLIVRITKISCGGSLVGGHHKALKSF
jgi:hypothetical protein